MKISLRSRSNSSAKPQSSAYSPDAGVTTPGVQLLICEVNAATCTRDDMSAEYRNQFGGNSILKVKALARPSYGRLSVFKSFGRHSSSLSHSEN